jgi:hypothetical protein
MGAKLSEIMTRSAERVEGSTYYFEGAFDPGSDWLRQQGESVERYQAAEYEADETLGVMFGNFIATTINRDALVLDIGCGLHPLHPHYVKELDLPYFVGIEPLTTPVSRNYECLAGVSAENIPLADGAGGGDFRHLARSHRER